MRLVKLTSDADGPGYCSAIYVNPQHVVAVETGLDNLGACVVVVGGHCRYVQEPQSEVVIALERATE